MKVNIGDKVRFLNEVGGGIVKRIEGTLVFVEVEDGFEIPTPINEAVVIKKATEDKEIIHRSDFSEQESEQESEQGSEQSNDDIEENDSEIIEEETHDESDPKIFLAFITPATVIDLKSKISAYLINDSNYFCVYTVSKSDETGLATLLYQGIINPNIKLLLDEKEIELIESEWIIQLMLFKKEKPFITIQPISTSVDLNQNRFFKRNAFETNDFFYQAAHLISLVKNELEKKVESITIEETEKIIEEKEVVVPQKSTIKRADTKDLLEIDLHIHELVDNTAGLSNSDMIKIQLDKFNSVMAANLKFKRKKVVFIHGVGNGTLKNEIRLLLNKKYKGIYYLDASFKEYGYGATMVVM
ncbi:MAG: DUF2027 domain-containing protein [Marinilabiliaceae bacterium]|nr:DUF2027 domain-containing protein [Marinilabiliaceae bacterium]